MNLEHQVTPPELSQRLKRLGVKQANPQFWWKGNRLLSACELAERHPSKKINEDEYAAFTVAELGEIIRAEEFEPPVWDIDEKVWKWNEYYGYPVKKRTHCIEGEPDTEMVEAEARGLMLEYLIKNNLMSV